MKASIGQTTIDHCRYVADHCRPADRLEFEALGVNPFKAMEYALNAPGLIYTGFIDNVPVCVFGVSDSSIIGRCGRPWLIGTELIEKHQKAFLKRNLYIVKIWRQLYDHLENYVDARNTQAITWLMWLGFEFDSEPVLIGQGMPFYRFSMEGL